MVQFATRKVTFNARDGRVCVARSFSRAFYHSKAWVSARDAYMRTPVRVPGRGTCPPGMCERCFSMGRLRPAEIVHHKVFLTPENVGDPSVTLSFDNLMRVCRDCHAEIHYPGESEPRVAFGPDGRVMRIG